MKTTGKCVSSPERGFAWVLTFLLTAFLSAALLSLLAVQGLTSAGMHLAAATGNGVADSQQARIYEQVDRLAEDCGFSPEGVKAAIRREDLLEMNRKAAAWWTKLCTEGIVDTIPRWNAAELEKAVEAGMNGETRTEDPGKIAAGLAEKIERVVFPLRESLLSRGMSFARSKADVEGMIRDIRRLPALGAALSLLAAGLIALLLGRDLFSSLKYYGTAAAGTGLTILATGIIFFSLHPGAMIEQASAALGREFGALAGQITLLAGGVTLFLLAAGYFCLILYRKKANNNTKATEQPV